MRDPIFSKSLKRRNKRTQPKTFGLEIICLRGNR